MGMECNGIPDSAGIHRAVGGHELSTAEFQADVKADNANTCRDVLAITAVTADVEWWCARTEEMVRERSGPEEREVPPDGRGSPTPSVWSQIGRRGGAGARAAVESTWGRQRRASAEKRLAFTLTITWRRSGRGGRRPLTPPPLQAPGGTGGGRQRFRAASTEKMAILDGGGEIDLEAATVWRLGSRTP
jgi:hypothetical protein